MLPENRHFPNMKNTKYNIGSIHSAVPNFSKTIQIIFGKQFRFRLFCKNDPKNLLLK